MSETPPPNFGRYVTIERIGAGAIGTVYRAEDPLIGRQVAIKIIRTAELDEAERKDYLARFSIEARAGGRCSHPAIVAIYDAGEMDGAPYLVMEFVTGKSLQAILADPEARAGLDVMRIMEDLLDALGHAHAQGIVHRDIKPANIMVTPVGRAKVADFGIARLEHSQHTQAGELLGTPNYMAPEQVLGTLVDHRTDLFSAAAVLHTMLTGKPPFAGRTMADTLLRVTDVAPVDLTLLSAGPFAAYAPVLRQGLAKDPAARFASAAAFANALRAVAQMPPPADEPTLVLSAAPGGITPEMLDETVVQLAKYLGPMARLHAAKAAKVARDETEFRTMLARDIPNPADAKKFLGGVTRAEGAGTTRATVSTQYALSGAAARGISPENAEAARAILAVYAGPIAKLLISQALREASSLDAMVDRLVQAVPDADQAVSLRRKLYAALSGG